MCCVYNEREREKMNRKLGMMAILPVFIHLKQAVLDYYTQSICYWGAITWGLKRALKKYTFDDRISICEKCLAVLLFFSFRRMDGSRRNTLPVRPFFALCCMYYRTRKENNGIGGRWRIQFIAAETRGKYLAKNVCCSSWMPLIVWPDLSA